MRTVMMRTVTLGKYQVNVTEECERVPRVVIRKLSRVLRRVNKLTSSLLVRVDMAPWYFDTKVPPIYEVETAPGGIWMFALFQQEHVLFRLASSLSVSYGVCSDPNWKEAYDLLAPYFRIVDSPFDCGEKGRIYWSALPDEVRCLPESWKSFVLSRLITDPLASKKELLKTLGLILSEDEVQHLVGLLSSLSSMKMKTDEICSFLKSYYPNLNGVVAKPNDGWGSKGIIIFPFDSQLRKQVSGCSTITKLTNTLSNFEQVVQPFFKPREEVVDGKTYYKIWRLFFFRKNREEEWRYLGGIWNSRANLIVHGASDSLFGPVVIKD